MFSSFRESKNNVAVDVFRHRELKWIEMLQNWDKWMTKKFPKVSYVLTVELLCIVMCIPTLFFMEFAQYINVIILIPVLLLNDKYPSL